MHWYFVYYWKGASCDCRFVPLEKKIQANNQILERKKIVVRRIEVTGLFIESRGVVSKFGGDFRAELKQKKWGLQTILTMTVKFVYLHYEESFVYKLKKEDNFEKKN